MNRHDASRETSIQCLRYSRYYVLGEELLNASREIVKSDGSLWMDIQGAWPGTEIMAGASSAQLSTNGVNRRFRW